MRVCTCAIGGFCKDHSSQCEYPPEAVALSGQPASRYFAPKWQDDNGNVVILARKGTIFTSWFEAFTCQVQHMPLMCVHGLMPMGILEFEAVDGKTKIRHRAGELGDIGRCCIIEGPLGPDAVIPEDTTSQGVVRSQRRPT